MVYPALAQKLWQNTSYLQRGGINNWLCAVMTFFLNGTRFAVQIFGGQRGLSCIPGYALGNIDG